MMDNSRRIAVSNILTPLNKDVEKTMRLIAFGKKFDRRETIQRDRDEFRRSVPPDDWTPDETADHDYLDEWSERLCKAADELKAAGETAIAGQLLTFYRQIDDRDEVTRESDFRFEELDGFLAGVLAGNEKEASGDGTPSGAPELASEKTSTVSTARNPLAKTESESVRLFDRSEQPIVNNNEMPTLTNAQYDVVMALLQAGSKGLTKDKLDQESKRGDARKILKRLSDSDPDWESVIAFPGTTGKGYRII